MTETVNFDPNSIGQKIANIYGLPFDQKSAQIVIVPVPWEVTVSYNAGTAEGPRAILDASFQVDLFDPDVPDAWKIGLALAETAEELPALNARLRPLAERYIGMLEEGLTPAEEPAMAELLEQINAGCLTMNNTVQARCEEVLAAGKMAAVVGGDHSTPLGLVRALGKYHSDFGILHFDAHADLRDAYEGFTYSHASIMFNVLKEKHVSKLVQVGIRDYCEQEAQLIRDSKGRVVTYYDRDIRARIFEGETWKQICDDIVSQLPAEVYVSFDVDGLDPKLCPHTGTPVPGGLEFEQALYVIKQVMLSGRKIIGFDLNEVAPGEEDEWDANVGARLLYRMANLAARSSGRA
ncbi:MAG: agmatinase family protein [Cyanobacteria bacterium SZAS TMP-1]|nr:agmatinase family protein [Cyanobacteria bacterium SZAS TMP-1]